METHQLSLCDTSVNLYLNCISLGWYNNFRKIKIPSAPILAAMIVGGFFYTLEITTARFPDIFINIAFVLLGSAIGCRLSGLAPKEIMFYSMHGVVVSTILLSIAGLFAYLLKVFLGFDFMTVFLSFAPGGIHEMVVISVAYNIDPILLVTIIF